MPFMRGIQHSNFHQKDSAMISKKIINPQRVRRIEGGFSFIPHRFLSDGFLASLEQKEILLYFFLVLVSDRYGLSFYSDDAICSLLQLPLDECMAAKCGLMDKDLIDFDGTVYQVLALPPEPLQAVPGRLSPNLDRRQYRHQVKNLIQQSLWGTEDGGQG
jgi:hypothetical protein